MTDYQQDELDLFSDPSAPSLPLCLYRSQARGLAARTAEFEAWQDQHGSFGSLLRAHAWTPGVSMPGRSDRCEATVLSVDLRQHRNGESFSLKCRCTRADVYLYRGACCCCDWEGVPRPAEVARAVWESACAHVDHETLLCALHQDELKAFLESGQILKCRHCRKLIRARIEPLR